MTPLPPVAIGIPTYKRPLMLARLLDSLRPEVEGRDVQVIVADNAPGPETPRVIEAHLSAALYVRVPEPGISQVRNAIIRTALRTARPWDWLAMIDDDGRAEPGWLEALIEGARRFDADVASGPVLRDLPAGVSLVARNSMFAGRPRHDDGPVSVLHGAQNMALSRRILTALDDPWFDPALGVIGGEDHHFYRRLQAAGAKLVWCDAAQVTEATPPDRLTTAAILRRAFRSNAIAARSDAQFLGGAEVLRQVGVGLGRNARNIAAGVARRDADRLARAGVSLVSLSGRVGGLVSRRQPTKRHGT